LAATSQKGGEHPIGEKKKTKGSVTRKGGWKKGKKKKINGT